MITTPNPLANVKIGIGLPTLGERDTLGNLDAVGAARHVEALGLDFVDAADLIVGDGTPTLEVTVALAAAAAVTERVRIELAATRQSFACTLLLCGICSGGGASCWLCGVLDRRVTLV